MPPGVYVAFHVTVYLVFTSVYPINLLPLDYKMPQETPNKVG